MDLRTICINLAARYAPGTISTPSGSQAMRAAYSTPQAAIAATPCVYVEVDNGDVVVGSGTWDVTHHLIVNFLLDKSPGDPSRVDIQRQLWLPNLLSATLGAMTLSTQVKSALPASYEFTEIETAGQLYDGIRIFVDAITRETVTLTA